MFAGKAGEQWVNINPGHNKTVIKHKPHSWAVQVLRQISQAQDVTDSSITKGNYYRVSQKKGPRKVLLISGLSLNLE